MPQHTGTPDTTPARLRIHEPIPFSRSDFPMYVLADMCARPETAESSGPDAPLSFHEPFEILYILEGTLRCEIEYSTFEASAGDLVRVNPGECHGFSATDAPCRYHCLMMDLSLLESGADGETAALLNDLRTGRLSFANRLSGDPESRSLFLEVVRDAQSEGPGRAMRVRGGLSCLFGRWFETDRTESYADELPASVKAAQAYIERHYGEPLKLADLARAAYMNPFSFCRLFRSATGRSPVSYLNAYRLSRARVLLLSTDLSVSEIAQKTGFADSGYFSKAFRARYGCPPGRMRYQNTVSA